MSMILGAGTIADAVAPPNGNGPAQAWSYPGIPYPTDNVPGAIMPTLPTGADTPAFPYDPCTLLAPVAPGNWPSAEATDYYYIDKFHGMATDTANTFGYPDKPRLSIPTGASGTSALYVEIHGDNGGYLDSSPDYDIGVDTLSMVGTPSQPIFWQGIDVPWLGQGFEVDGQHIILDGISLQNNNGSPLIPHLSVNAGAEFFTYRNGALRGTGGAITGGVGQMITIGGTSTTQVKFVVIYNNVIRDGGEWDVDHSKDIHAIRPLYWNRYNWFINNDLSRVQGDLVQTGNSANGSSDQAQRSHYIYIAGNNMEKAFENALDNKNSFHVICSSNTIHDFGVVAGPGTAIILSNNSEGEFTSYHWAINNEIFDFEGGAIRFSGDQINEKSYAIGNWIHDGDQALRHGDHGGNKTQDEWSIHNTITNCERGMDFPFTWSDELFLRGNITYNCTVDHIQQNSNLSNFGETTLTHHMSYNGDMSATGINQANFDNTGNNQIDTDPEFTNPGSDDFTLQSGSPALGAMATIDPVFAEFFNLYGISIQEDIQGNPLPATNVDLGAFQRV